MVLFRRLTRWERETLGFGLFVCDASVRVAVVREQGLVAGRGLVAEEVDTPRHSSQTFQDSMLPSLLLEVAAVLVEQAQRGLAEQAATQPSGLTGLPEEQARGMLAEPVGLQQAP
jgi:hypothetical protein